VKGDGIDVAEEGYRVTGIQQVGIGVSDLKNAWRWYADHLGFDVPAFNDAAEAPFMTDYTGGAVQSRQAALAINMHGGGGFEVWQYTSRAPVPPAEEPRLGDHGILATRLKSGRVHEAFTKLKSAGADCLSVPQTDPAGKLHFFVKDPYGNTFQVIEADGWFSRRPGRVGGVGGVMVGTPDIDLSLPLYREVLGYDHIVYDETGSFADLAPLPEGERRVRRVLLTHSQPRSGGFARLLGPTSIELVESLDAEGARIFADRYWGDLGFIHVCFEVQGMEALKEAAAAAGFPFTVDSGKSFDMGEAAGRFAYVEDAGGTLVEFVETHRVPIVPALGITVNLGKGGRGKAVPGWILRLLALKRTRTL
jgi:catechol 2,3-dioxygenase-like lactoylglutathione lyase family enzyme